MEDSSFSISKSTFVRGSKCVTSLYLNKYHSDLRDSTSESTQALFDTGHEVGKLARQLFPGGVNSDYFDDFNVSRAVEKTWQLINNGQKVIYEAAFIYDECLAIIDMLVIDSGNWFAYEVKSSTSVKEEHILDVSYQYYVIKNAGIDLKDVFVVFLNNQYVRTGELDIKELFIVESVSQQVSDNLEHIAMEAKRFKDILTLKEIPQIGIGEYCSKPHECDFSSYCWKDVPEFSVFDIAGLSWKKKMELYNAGIIKMIDVPGSFKLNDSQKLQIDSLRDDNDRVNKPSLNLFLSELSYPLYFLDFETIRPAIPLFDNSRPHQQIPFQYSLHRLDRSQSQPTHCEFLADASEDPRKPLIESLLNSIQSVGDIIVYYLPFEKNRLSELARDFPEFQKAIASLIPRLKDLIVPFKNKSFYRPAMNGSNSIKDVLPALVPEFSYSNLAINNGDLASLAFMKLLNRNLNEYEVSEIRQNLSKYCGLDTYAMVRILWELQSKVN